MRIFERPIATAKLIGGRLCLDFVNTCGGRTEDGQVTGDRLLEFADLAAWGLRTGVESGPGALRLAANDPEEAAKVYQRAVALRDACYHLLRGVIDSKPPATA